MTRLWHVPVPVRGAKHNEINLLGSRSKRLKPVMIGNNTDFPLTGIEFDSRKIVKGNLFVPLQGENDGHRFLRVPWLMAVVPLLGTGFSRCAATMPVLHVTDPLVAMQKLATYYLNKMQPNVIAVTGSNGKLPLKI